MLYTPNSFHITVPLLRNISWHFLKFITDLDHTGQNEVVFQISSYTFSSRYHP